MQRALLYDIVKSRVRMAITAGNIINGYLVL